MPAELEPGVFTAALAPLEEVGKANARSALTGLALLVESQAKINALGGTHKYGTPTPAARGSGPAVVSGTLRRSITHSPVTPTGTGYEVLVGMAAGFYPPYPYHSRSGGAPKRTPSSKYAYYLETGLRGGYTYPFLKPAAGYVTRVAANAMSTAMLGMGWLRV